MSLDLSLMIGNWSHNLEILISLFWSSSKRVRITLLFFSNDVGDADTAPNLFLRALSLTNWSLIKIFQLLQMISIAQATHAVILSDFYSVFILEFLESFQVFEVDHILRYVEQSLSIVSITEFISKCWILGKPALCKYLLVFAIIISRILILLFTCQIRLTRTMKTWSSIACNNDLFIFFLLY